MPEKEELLTVSQAADLLGVSKATVRAWENRGRIVAQRHPGNGYRLFEKEALQKLLAEGESPPSTASRRNGPLHPPTPNRPALSAADLGQHMTPMPVASQMANFFQSDPAEWRVIDPACGDGNLLLAVAELLVASNCPNPASQLCGLDLDPTMVSQAREKLGNYLGVRPEELNIHVGDFLKESEPTLFKDGTLDLSDYNLVISNPPYGRNREFAFFETCANTLGEGSELVFLMPLSFIDRIEGVFTVPLPGRPLKVTTGHAIVYHRCGNNYKLRSVKHSQTNRTEFDVLSGLKLYELGAGIPAQTRQTIEEKPYSSDTPREGWLPCLRTGDIQPEEITTGRLFVKHGKHLAHPKDIERFEGPKVFVRRVPIWKTKSIGAAYSEDTLLCCGDVLVVRHANDDPELLQGLCRYLNSPEAASYIANARPSIKLRDSFPKISAKDLNHLLNNHLPSDAELRRLAAAQKPLESPHQQTRPSVKRQKQLLKSGRFIDASFPIASVSASCAREKSIRHGHVSTLQMWWARRPLAVCRSSIFATLIPHPETIESSPAIKGHLEKILPGPGTLSKRLTAFIGRLSTWESGTDKTTLTKASEILKVFWKSPPEVLDFFAGGGSIPLEALRLGLKVTASDLNPVATSILQASLDRLPNCRDEVITLYETICEKTAERLSHKATPIFPAKDGTPLAYFWFRTFHCPKCTKISPLYKNLILATKPNKVVASLRTRKGITTAEVLSDPTPQQLDFAKQGNISKNTATCIHCASTVTSKELRAQGQSGLLGEQLYAKRVQTPEGKIQYLPIASNDLKAAKASKGPEDCSAPSVPLDRNGIRHTWAQQYGVKSTSDLYNPRQGTSLGQVMKLFQQELSALTPTLDANELHTLALLLSFTLNRLAGYNNRHSWWQANGEFPAHIFGRQAIPFVWNYVEIPPFSPAAGGLASASTWISRAARHLQNIPRKARVFQADARSIPVEDRSIDLVAIDPPYYDSIAYSYLSDVFYAWMRPLLKKFDSELFSADSSPKAEEAIVDRNHSLAPAPKTDSHFRRKMTEALREARRILKPDGRMLIMYGHKSPVAWAALFDAMAAAGVHPISSWPVHMERNVKFQHGKVDALATATILVCETSPPETLPPVEWSSAELKLRAVVGRLKLEMAQLDFRKDDLATAAIGPVMEEILKHEAILENGSPMTSARILERALSLVSP